MLIQESLKSPLLSIYLLKKGESSLCPAWSTQITQPVKQYEAPKLSFSSILISF